MAASHTLHSIILWGPPGSGKTTIHGSSRASRERCSNQSRRCCQASPTCARLSSWRAANSPPTDSARCCSWTRFIAGTAPSRTRFCRRVESGLLTLIGATTENPSFEVIGPLLSRTKVLVLNPLSEADLAVLIKRALADSERGLGGFNLILTTFALRGTCGAGERRRPQGAQCAGNRGRAGRQARSGW